MKSIAVSIVALAVFGLSACAQTPYPRPDVKEPAVSSIVLPAPVLDGSASLEKVLYQRRSIREYSSEALELTDLSQLLWSGQGTTADWGGRTVPSAGALYPLELYVAVGNVKNLAPGIYKYEPVYHTLKKTGDADIREKLFQASLNQSCVKDAAIDIVIAAVYERTTVKYGERGVRYVYLEAGHAAQNICLQATALGLGAVTVGAFYDEQVSDIIGLSEGENPLYVIPVGRKR
ncbi:MAG: SagB/ThcOx family dehydrogenase [Dehalococcoidia bacterium]|nr:SagB/ThcOx family dehydrogenase [Dehalococcoidia bacterium]